MLKATDLYKSYGELQVLKGVTLEVAKGELVSIVGASGAGKSTLLHILGTLDSADGGQLTINEVQIDHTLKPTALHAFRNKNLGFIFQFHNLLPEFSAVENVALPGFIANNRSEKEVLKEAEDLLKQLNIGNRIHHKPGHLSGGEQQRVAVARALINRPALVLADEPSGNLDSKNAEELHQLFFDLRDAYDQTFIIVTHNRELATMADRVLTIEDGRML